VSFCFSFGFDGGEELRSHHLHRALDHPLSDAGDRASDLHLSAVFDQRRDVSLFKVEIAGAFQEAGLALSVNDDSIVRVRRHVFELDVAGEDSFDRADAAAQNG